MKSNVILWTLAGAFFVSGVLTQHTLIVLIAVVLMPIVLFDDVLRRYAPLESPKVRTRRRIETLK